ncbi:MAG: hypothetical protein A2289_21210 [Deltaproteobacteria bacterium RIFOXYA12_FULL_58_15]|nr:MAG: hypothetical protein A2289_21210 [Deltaproteobacteria bacterium RIFOXYA12_FULL_58_15]OGR08724.1 MAG: hypothetical protein A2341_00820 [Deltaproteobacteria bacterium RIFOXYB12_FULL_58_9]
MDIVRIAKESLRIAWSRKSLWLFGLFVAAGSGSAGGSDASSAKAATGVAAAAVDSLPTWLPWAIAGAVVLGFCGLFMHVVSEGALIEGAVRAKNDEPFTVRQGMRGGMRSFWAVFKVKAIMFGVALGSIAVLAAPVILYSLDLLPVGAAIPLGILAVIMGVPWVVTLYLIYALALRFVVLDNRNALDSIGKARLFLHGRLASTLLLFLAVGIGQIGAGVVIVLCLIPIALLAGAGYLAAGIPAAIAIGVLFGLPLAVATGGALGTYQSTVWTLGYLEARASEG